MQTESGKANAKKQRGGITEKDFVKGNPRITGPRRPPIWWKEILSRYEPVIEVRVNLASLLRFEETVFCSIGAGRGILFERHARTRVA